MQTQLPPASSVLAVCAHPDDESFGLGAVLARFREAGSRLSVLTFTHGEASTLHGDDRNLAVVRKGELEAASAVLGVDRTELLAYPDGGLSQVSLDELAAHVARLAREVTADLLLVFDEGGISGHPDHCQATAAALTAARALRLPVLAFALPRTVADALNEEFGTAFVGRDAHDLDLAIAVDRAIQIRAIHCHASQSGTNPVLWRRLALLGTHEWLRSLIAARQPTAR